MTIYAPTYCPGDPCDPCIYHVFSGIVSGTFGDYTADFIAVGGSAGDFLGATVPVAIDITIHYLDASGSPQNYLIHTSGSGIYHPGASFSWSLASYNLGDSHPPYTYVTTGNVHFFYGFTSVDVPPASIDTSGFTIS